MWLAVTRIRTWVASATTKSTNHYTITATEPLDRRNEKHNIKRKVKPFFALKFEQKYKPYITDSNKIYYSFNLL